MSKTRTRQKFEKKTTSARRLSNAGAAMKLIVALALALAPLRTDADGPPAKGGLRVFERAPGDKKLDASSRDAARKPRASRDASVDTRRARPNSSPTTPRRASPAQ